ncbi:MAG: bifunctional folylpolyglutamate synthase/dihydrofolate synthase, partial [Kiritimatiellae bacterium]|nr:bifunctional folylpolyglutamate synthase/dihydrofolate synthase [Kiritimatiellia bacterium]
RRLVAVHVAGTNGKGSVCAMIESCLRASGVRTGLYTSPHLVRFHERIRVDGRPVSDATLEDLIRRATEAAEGYERANPPGGAATFFELATAMAFLHFAESGVQAAVIETGMGGRWDATNVLCPALSVITEIDMDHTDYLGASISAIAWEKAGILKPGRPALSAPQRAEVEEILRSEAAQVGAPLAALEDRISVRRQGKSTRDGQRVWLDTPEGALPPVRSPLIGAHQTRNIALAAAAVRELSTIAGAPPDDAALVRGLEQVEWPARLQLLRRDPPVLLDGAHNPHGARALADALRELTDRAPVGLIINMMADKDVDAVARILAPRVKCAWVPPIPVARALDPGRMAIALRGAGLREVSVSGLNAAWDEAVAWAARENGWVCIAGSLYLAGEVLRSRADGDRLFCGGEPA